MTTTTISYGRTKSHNYQSEKFEIELEVLAGWTTGETLALAKGLVNEVLGLKQDRRKINKLLRAYYGDDNLYIEDFLAVEREED